MVSLTLLKYLGVFRWVQEKSNRKVAIAAVAAIVVLGGAAVGGLGFAILVLLGLVSLTLLKYLEVFEWVQKRSNRKVAIAAVAVVLLIGGAAATGVFTQPSGGVQDYGDWGNVTDERTEIITTLWVANPNFIGLSSNNLRATYQIELNGVDIAEGEKDGIAIQPGNNTIQLSTYIINDRIPDWWVKYVENNETITAGASGEVHIGEAATFNFPEQRPTYLQNSTPVITSLSKAAGRLEGEYTRSTSEGTSPSEESVTVGYEIQQGRATWDRVSEDTTTLLFHLQIHNPGDVPVPAVPDGLGVSVDMNDIRMFRAQEEALSPRNVGQDGVIRPGETKEVILAVTLDNDNVDDWFISHVSRSEYSNIVIQLQLVFNVQETGTTLRIPKAGGVTYQCEMQTGILEDGQTTSTTCGDEGSQDRTAQTPTETKNRTAREETRNLYASGLEAVDEGDHHFRKAEQTYKPENTATYKPAAEDWAQSEQSYAKAAEHFGNAANIASQLGLYEVERICEDARQQAILRENASRNFKLSLRAALDGNYEKSERLYRTGHQERQQFEDVFVSVASFEEILGL
jgi:LEA14-like dessication related protein